MVPSSGASYNGFVMAGCRGVYNSPWIGTIAGITVVSLLSLIGFYLVKDSIARDYDARAGQIAARSDFMGISASVAVMAHSMTDQGFNLCNGTTDIGQPTEGHTVGHFKWDGMRWWPGQAIGRLLWLAASCAVVMLSAIPFDRFDPARQRLRIKVPGRKQSRMIAGHPDQVLALIVGAAFVSALALALGVMTNGSRAFQIVYPIPCYIGLSGKFVWFDFKGIDPETIAAGVPLLYIALAASLFALPYRDGHGKSGGGENARDRARARQISRDGSPAHRERNAPDIAHCIMQ